VLLSAGFGAGLVGSVAGLASLLSYPALLAVGLPPLAANVSNTVALVFSGVGSALGSRVELRGQAPRLRPLGAAALAGGATGAALLLLTPASAFETVVPLLVLVASVLVLLAPSPSELAELTVSGAGPRLMLGIFAVGIYGGYFGAAAGVMMLALLLTATRESTVRLIAAKNALLGLSNGVAAVAFVLLGPVLWAAVLPLGLGFFLGGRLGPTIARRAPARLLRTLVGVTGVALAAYLAVDTYG
jgi:hypothetical protein